MDYTSRKKIEFCKGYDEVKDIFKAYKKVKCYPAFVTQEVIQGKKQKEKCFHHEEYESILKKQTIDYDKINIEDVLRPGVGICMAEHRYSWVYTPDGYVYKCINDICMPKYSIRNILHDNQEGNAVVMAKYMGRDSFSENECSECKFLPLCYGRCVSEYRSKGNHACPDIKYLLQDIVINKYLREEDG